VPADLSTPVTQLPCQACGRVQTCTRADLRAYAVIGTPKCCARTMAVPRTDLFAAGRSCERGVIASGTRAEVRRLSAEEGFDFCAGLADLSADGARVRLTAPVMTGERLVVGLVHVGGREVAHVPGQVRWSRPLGGGLFAAGLEFDRPLTRVEMANLVR
jgi:hypothetical protein